MTDLVRVRESGACGGFVRRKDCVRSFCIFTSCDWEREEGSRDRKGGNMCVGKLGGRGS